MYFELIILKYLYYDYNNLELYVWKESVMWDGVIFFIRKYTSFYNNNVS